MSGALLAAERRPQCLLNLLPAVALPMLADFSLQPSRAGFALGCSA